MTAKSGIGHRAWGIGLAVSTMSVALRAGNALVSVQAANTEVAGCNPSRLSGTRRRSRSAAAHRRARRLSRSSTGVDEERNRRSSTENVVVGFAVGVSVAVAVGLAGAVAVAVPAAVGLAVAFELAEGERGAHPVAALKSRQ